MRLGRVLIIVALVLVIGVVAVYFVLNQSSGEPTPEEMVEVVEINTIDVIFIEQPVSRGELITEDHLGYLEYPAESAIEGMFTDMTAVVGLRARYDLNPPVVLLENMVIQDLTELSEAGSDHALLIPKGYVAVAIPIDRLSSVAYGLTTGDHVSVIVNLLFTDLDQEFQTRLPNNTAGFIAPGVSVLVSTETEEQQTVSIMPDIENLTAQVASGGSISPFGRAYVDPVLQQPMYIVPGEDSPRPRLVSQILLKDVVVLHVGDFEYEDPELLKAAEAALAAEEEAAAEEATPQDGPPVTTQPEEILSPPDIITLIVTPQDAVTLNYLLYSSMYVDTEMGVKQVGAQLSLALRASGDTQQEFTQAVTLQYLMDSYNIPLPAKLDYGLEPRIDYLVPPTLENDIVIPVEE